MAGHDASALGLLERATDLPDAFHFDVEQKAVDNAHLLNTTVQNFTWSNITVTVKDNKTKQPKNILDNVSGIVQAGMSIPSVHMPSLLV